MPHMLMERDGEFGRENPHAFKEPFIVTCRYRCPCANGEVIQISTVFDLDVLGVDWAERKIHNEEAFHWTMKRMLRDILTEIRQHTNQAPPQPATEGTNG